MRRSRASTLLVVALLALATAGLVRSAGVGGRPSPDERAHAIAQSLRCPTCQGLSVADSGSPLATSMRRIVDERVAAGQSADEVRDFFVDRYGSWVLLSPPAQGVGWLVWLVPVAVLLLGLVVAGVRMGRRVASQPVRWTAVGLTLAVAVAALMATSLSRRGADQMVTGTVPRAGGAEATAGSPDAAAPGEEPGQPAGTRGARLEELRAAVQRTPEDTRTRLALASTAFELGRFDVVRAQAGAVLDRQPRNVDALLLRGLAPSSPEDSAARTSLRRFVDLAPLEHPGLPLAEEILGGER